MKKYVKVLLFTSVGLMAAGAILGVTGLAMGGRPGFTITKSGLKMAEDIQGDLIEKKVSLKGIRNLDVSCMECPVEIVVGEEFYMEYAYDDSVLQVKEEKKDGTYQFASSYQEQLDVGGTFFTIGSGYYHSKTGYLKIYIPEGTELESIKLNNSYGNVTADYPGLSVEDFEIYLESGDLNLSGVNCQKMNVNIEYGNLNLLDCETELLTIDDETGEGYLENIQSDTITAKFSSGTLQMLWVNAGELNIKNESGDITLEEGTGSHLNIEQSYGDVKLSGLTVEKEICAKNEAGEIRMSNIKADSLELSNESGNVTGEQVSTKQADMDLEYGECEFSDLTAEDVSIDSESGSIALKLTGSREEYDWDLATAYGTIVIDEQEHGSGSVREKGAPYRLKLSSEEGDIRIAMK